MCFEIAYCSWCFEHWRFCLFCPSLKFSVYYWRNITWAFTIPRGLRNIRSAQSMKGYGHTTCTSYAYLPTWWSFVLTKLQHGIVITQSLTIAITRETRHILTCERNFFFLQQLQRLCEDCVGGVRKRIGLISGSGGRSSKNRFYVNPILPNKKIVTLSVF